MEPQKKSPHPVPWLAVALALSAILAIYYSPGNQGLVPKMSTLRVSSTDATVPTMPPKPMNGRVFMAESTSVSSGIMGGSAVADYYPYPSYGEVAATDTREFLKKDYSATIRTRNVRGLSRTIETTVRGHDGRIDNISSSPKNGYISFVIPETEFEEFRTEIENMVNARFLSVSIQEQNMLPQKISIEEQQKSVEKSLEEMRVERQKIVSDHNASVRSLQSQIDSIQTAIAKLDREFTTDQFRQNQIIIEKAQLSSEKFRIENNLSSENANYASRLKSADAQITYTEERLKGVKEQDQDLLDTVATVRGTISLNWISLWEIAHLYLPGYWIPSILALASLGAYWWSNRRHGVRTEVVSTP